MWRWRKGDGCGDQPSLRSRKCGHSKCIRPTSSVSWILLSGYWCGPKNILKQAAKRCWLKLEYTSPKICCIWFCHHFNQSLKFCETVSFYFIEERIYLCHKVLVGVSMFTLIVFFAFIVPHRDLCSWVGTSVNSVPKSIQIQAMPKRKNYEVSPGIIQSFADQDSGRLKKPWH